jgi:hypothetical protein
LDEAIHQEEKSQTNEDPEETIYKEQEKEEKKKKQEEIEHRYPKTPSRIVQKNHPKSQILGDIDAGVQILGDIDAGLVHTLRMTP